MPEPADERLARAAQALCTRSSASTPGGGGAASPAVRRGDVRGGRGAEAARWSASISACPTTPARRVKAAGAISHRQRDHGRRGALARGARRRCGHRAGLRGGRPHRALPRLRPGRSDGAVRAPAAGRRRGRRAGDRRGRDRRRPRNRGGLRARRQRRAARHRLSPHARSARSATRIAPASPQGTTLFTNLMTGGLARGLHGRLIDELGPVRGEAPPYPLASAALAPIRNAAEAQGEYGFGPMWAGQAAPLGEAAAGRRADSKLAADALAILGRAGVGRAAWRSSPSPPSPTITSGWSTTRRAAKPRSSIRATPRRCWPRPAPRLADHPGLEHPLAPRSYGRQCRDQGSDRLHRLGPGGGDIPGRDVALSRRRRSCASATTSGG